MLSKLSGYYYREVSTVAEVDIKKSLAKFEGAVEDLEEVMRSKEVKSFKGNQGLLTSNIESLQLTLLLPMEGYLSQGRVY